MIGQELGAQSLLEGGFQRPGERVLVTARLIDAETHTHLWSADRERAYSVAELFDIQRFPIDRYDGSSKASSAKGSWNQVRVYRG